MEPLPKWLNLSSLLKKLDGEYHAKPVDASGCQKQVQRGGQRGLFRNPAIRVQTGPACRGHPFHRGIPVFAQAGEKWPDPVYRFAACHKKLATWLDSILHF